MNIIFLGIDGVLTTARTTIAYNESCIKALDPVAVRMLASICKQSNMKICICSSWRTQTPLRADFVLNLSYYGGGPLVKHMLKGDDWRTPIFGDHQNREVEINTWLALHPEVKTKVVITSDVAGPSLEAFHVKTLSYDGYSFQNYLDTIKIIEEKALLYGK